MKTSEIFKAAKKHLSKKELDGICAAIGLSPGSYIERERARSIIQSRLEGYGYATQWLASKMIYKGPVNANHADYNKIWDWIMWQDTKKLQAWRHAWLDQLIAEFEAKGD